MMLPYLWKIQPDASKSAFFELIIKKKEDVNGYLHRLLGPFTKGSKDNHLWIHYHVETKKTAHRSSTNIERLIY